MEQLYPHSTCALVALFVKRITFCFLLLIASISFANSQSLNFNAFKIASGVINHPAFTYSGVAWDGSFDALLTIDRLKKSGSAIVKRK